MAQTVTTWDGQTWLLDPGALFLDFVYTGEFGVGTWRDGIVWSGPDLDTWLAEHVASGLRPTTARELKRAIGLRDSLTRLAKAAAGTEEAEQAGDRRLVTQTALRPDLPPLFPGDGPPAPFTTEQALSTIARDAVVHLRDHSDRLRNCCSTDCPMVFLDLSRAGRRSWCSMSRCGNRAKARAFRSRATGQQNDQGDAT